AMTVEEDGRTRWIAQNPPAPSSPPNPTQPDPDRPSTRTWPGRGPAPKTNGGRRPADRVRRGVQSDIRIRPAVTVIGDEARAAVPEALAVEPPARREPDVEPGRVVERERIAVVARVDAGFNRVAAPALAQQPRICTRV